MAEQQKQGGEGGGEYVRVYVARNLIEAEFLKGLLVSNEIPAIIEDEASESVGLGESAFNRGVPILAPDSQADEAKAILADRQEHADDEEDEDDD